MVSRFIRLQLFFSICGIVSLVSSLSCTDDEIQMQEEVYSDQQQQQQQANEPGTLGEDNQQALENLDPMNGLSNSSDPLSEGLLSMDDPVSEDEQGEASVESPGVNSKSEEVGNLEGQAAQEADVLDSPAPDTSGGDELVSNSESDEFLLGDDLALENSPTEVTEPAASEDSMASSMVAGIDSSSNTFKYKIQKGDWLSKIAKSVYKDMSLWRRIFEENSALIQNPDLIYAGKIISIPIIGPEAEEFAKNYIMP